MSETGPATSLQALPRFESGVAAFVAARWILIRDLVKYGLCSALALTLDWGTLVALVGAGVAPLAAAATGFLLGMTVTYTLSIVFIFADRRQQSLLRETLTFVGVGFAGLGITQAMLWGLIHQVGLAPGIAKAPTAIVVFLFNFVLRRTLVFAKSDT